MYYKRSGASYSGTSSGGDKTMWPLALLVILVGAVVAWKVWKDKQDKAK